MTSNAQDIIRDIRKDFDMLIDFVTGEDALTATADYIERGLFKLLLSLGAKLLRLFFTMRCAACSREPLSLSDGQTLPYHQDTKRDYFSIFGKLAVWRPYFYQKGIGSEHPLDAELSVGEDCYSDLLREIADYLGVYNVYGKSSDILLRLLGLKLSTRVVEENLAEDAVDVTAYYEQKPAPAPADEAEILVIQADGKGVPLVLETAAERQVRLGKGEKRGRKKEAIVTTVYTIAAAPRTAEEVVASLYGQKKQDDESPASSSKRPRPQNKHIWATLEGKDVALARLAQQVAPREGNHIQHRVALCDGCPALQTRIESHFPDFTLILDFIHANEYMWDVANSWLGETNEQRDKWMRAHTLQLLTGETKQVIAALRELTQEPQCTASQRTQLNKTANYFERNLPYMDYSTCLAKGWPIASGVIEGACRHLVKDRCELSGMRWLQQGAENLLRLRAVAENGDWDTYHTFRKHQRHQRLYNSPFPNQTAALEEQALDSEPDQDSLVTEPVNPSNRASYYALPLVA